MAHTIDTIGHNSKLSPEELDQAILDLHQDLLEPEQREAKAKEDKRKLRASFKARTGYALADFDAGRRLSGIEDDEQRHDKLEALSRCFNALKPGEQLNFLDAAP